MGDLAVVRDLLLQTITAIDTAEASITAEFNVKDALIVSLTGERDAARVERDALKAKITAALAALS